MTTLAPPRVQTVHIIGYQLLGRHPGSVTFHRRDCWHIEHRRARKETRSLNRLMAESCGFHACENCRP